MVRAMLASSLQGVVAQTLLRRTGGGGRVGAYEVLVGTNAVRNLIRENQVAQLYSMIQTGSRYGMVTMEDAINALVEEEMISKEEGRRALLTSTDDEADEHDEDIASAALGGGRMGVEGRGKKKLKAIHRPSAEQGDVNDNEGYSF